MLKTEMFVGKRTLYPEDAVRLTDTQVMELIGEAVNKFAGIAVDREGEGLVLLKDGTYRRLPRGYAVGTLESPVEDE